MSTKRTRSTPKSTAAAADDIDPTATYEIELSRSVKLGPTWMRPTCKRLRVLGATLPQLGDAVVSRKLVPSKVD